MSYDIENVTEPGEATTYSAMEGMTVFTVLKDPDGRLVAFDDDGKMLVGAKADEIKEAVKQYKEKENE